MQASPSPKSKSAPPCPIGRAADVLGDRWTLLIVRNATIGMSRFDDFKADLGIADNILSTRLTRLVDAGIFTKAPYRSGGRTRYEYRLTEAGADLLPILRALAAWGQQHTDPDTPAPPMRIMHMACGHETAGDYTLTCGHCGRPVQRDDEAWVRPWHSDTPLPLAPPVTEPGAPRP